MTWKVPVLRILVLFTRITSSSEFRQNPQCSVSIPIALLLLFEAHPDVFGWNQRPWLSTWSLCRLGDTVYLQVINVCLNSSSDSNVPSMQLIPAILYVAQTRWLSRKVLALSDSWMAATVFHNIVLPNHSDIPISPPIWYGARLSSFSEPWHKTAACHILSKIAIHTIWLPWFNLHMEKKYWCPWDSSRDWRQPLSVKGFSAWSRSVIIIWRNKQMASDPLLLWRNWEVSDTEIREGWHEKSSIETCRKWQNQRQRQKTRSILSCSRAKEPWLRWKAASKSVTSARSTQTILIHVVLVRALVYCILLLSSYTAGL